MFTTLATLVTSLGSQYMKNRAEKSAARHKVEIAKISGSVDADHASAEGMQHSLKDEFLTILLSTPLMVIFYASLWGDPSQIEQVKAAFTAMSDLPEWYTWSFMGCVVASFGLRTFKSFK